MRTFEPVIQITNDLTSAEMTEQKGGRFVDVEDMKAEVKKAYEEGRRGVQYCWHWELSKAKKRMDEL